MKLLSLKCECNTVWLDARSEALGLADVNSSFKKRSPHSRGIIAKRICCLFSCKEQKTQLFKLLKRMGKWETVAIAVELWLLERQVYFVRVLDTASFQPSYFRARISSSRSGVNCLSRCQLPPISSGGGQIPTKRPAR